MIKNFFIAMCVAVTLFSCHKAKESMPSKELTYDVTFGVKAFGFQEGQLKNRSGLKSGVFTNGDVKTVLYIYRAGVFYKKVDFADITIAAPGNPAIEQSVGSGSQVVCLPSGDYTARAFAYTDNMVFNFVEGVATKDVSLNTYTNDAGFWTNLAEITFTVNSTAVTQELKVYRQFAALRWNLSKLADPVPAVPALTVSNVSIGSDIVNILDLSSLTPSATIVADVDRYQTPVVFGALNTKVIDVFTFPGVAPTADLFTHQVMYDFGGVTRTLKAKITQYDRNKRYTLSVTLGQSMQIDVMHEVWDNEDVVEFGE